MPRPAIVVRVFTRGLEGGNHLGVINDVIGLDTSGMQRIAADLAFSETVFVEWLEGDVPHVRIFTPIDELPFAGHPLVGAAWVLLRLGPGGIGRLRCGIGDVAVRTDEDVTWVDVPMQGQVRPAPEAVELCRRSGLPEPVRSWWVDIPLPYLLTETNSTEAVATALPDMGPLAEHFGTLLFARNGDRVRARFFAPGTGVPEDPATGSAAVALATALAHEGEASGRLVVDQGEEIGHPSRIQLRWRPGFATIGGTVVRDEVRFLEA